MPVGQDVMISVYNIHRSPAVWDSPNDFIPERFGLDGPPPNETTTDFRRVCVCVCVCGVCAPRVCPCAYVCWGGDRAVGAPSPVRTRLALPMRAHDRACTRTRTRSHPLSSRARSFIPFSGGPRKCVGDQFALLEAVTALAVLISRYDFAAVPGADPGMTTARALSLVCLPRRSNDDDACVHGLI